MACSYPMWRIDWEKHLLQNGWARHRLADYYEKRVHNGGVIINRPEFEMLQKEYPALAAQIQQIPCGKCMQCRLKYSRDWANRCMFEYKTAQNAFFFTFTYDNANLHFSPHVDVETGACSIRPCLVPKHLQDFFKRLRKNVDKLGYEVPLRFFACGEYGSETLRPHYHAIIYNLPTKFLEKSEEWTSHDPSYKLWRAPGIEKIWKHGLCVYGDVNWLTCAYVARYIVDKQLGKNKAKQEFFQSQVFPGEPWQDEFVRMSRKPGIGRQYYDEHKQEIYKWDAIPLELQGTIRDVRPGKYFDKLFDVEQPKILRKLKRRRAEQADRAFKAALMSTDLSEVEYLELQERSKILAVERLPRPDI